MKKQVLPPKPPDDGEFLWLVSLSDLMILLFVFFVVMYSFAAKNMKQNDFLRIAASLRHEAAPKDPIDEVQNNVKKWVKDLNLGDKVMIKKEDDALRVDITDKLLFSTGDFEPHVRGVQVISLMRSILEKVPVPYQIGIEGHTDDDPIHTKTIKDNWDLSAKRAHSILQTLNLSPNALKRAVLMAYGDKRPLVPNRDKNGNAIPLNQAKNRRVTIRIF